MVEKDNSHTRSTANILDSLKEEELADADLSPDSPIRKKRDTERFNDILYAAFVQAMRIRAIIDAHWRVLLEKARQQYERDIKSHKNKFQLLKLMIMEKSQLSTKQLEKISAIKEAFLKLIDKIKNKIILLNKEIEKQSTHINHLRRERDELKNQFIESWKNAVAAMPLPNTIEIPFTLPAEYAKYCDDTNKLQRFLALSGERQKGMLALVGDKFETVSGFIVNDLIRKEAVNDFIRAVKSDLSFLPEDKQEGATDWFVKNVDFQKVVNPLLQFVNDNPELRIEHDKYFAKDLEYQHAVAKNDATVALRDQYASELTQIGEMYKQLDALGTMVNEGGEYKGDNVIDEKLDEFSHCFDKLEFQLDNTETNEQLFSETDYDFDFGFDDASDLLSELTAFNTDVEKTPDPHQLEILEEKQSEIEAKIDDFEQTMKRHEEEVGNEITETYHPSAGSRL